MSTPQEIQQKDNSLIQFNQDGIVLMQQNSGYVGISDRDWKRVENAVNRCTAPTELFSNIAYCLFGVAGSAFITLISILSSTVELWIKLCLLIAFLFPLIMGGYALCSTIENNNISKVTFL